MKPKTRFSQLLAGVSICFAMITTGVAADEYPAKTIEVVTHAGNGGGTDVTTRV